MFIIVDIDGTIVDKKGRAIQNVLNVVHMLAAQPDVQVVISTARPHERHQETVQLLDRLNLKCGQLLMNTRGFTDDAAKEDNALTPDNTLSVFENNKDCIKMYRRLGFTVFGCKKPEKVEP